MLTLFEVCVRSRFPLFSVRTNDPIYLKDVVHYYSGGDLEITIAEIIEGFPDDQPNSIIIADAYEGSLIEIYEQAKQLNSSVILINVEDSNPIILDSGEVPIPEELLRKHVNELITGYDWGELYNELRGLSIKESLDLLHLSSGYYGNCDLKSLQSIRHLMAPPTPGLYGVDLSGETYVRRNQVTQFLTKYRRSFEDPNSGKLSPRGLLFKGEPGVGKTYMAKIIAMELGIPLYRASLGGAMDRWHGQSEQNLNRILFNAEKEAPCVLLFDEVEKQINVGDDTGIASRMLEQLLWWLAEHKSKVLTIMTTNDVDRIPRELYREGRINEVIEVEGLTKDEASEFVHSLSKYLAEIMNYPEIMELDIPTYLDSVYGENIRVSVAHIENHLYSIIRVGG